MKKSLLFATSIVVALSLMTLSCNKQPEPGNTGNNNGGTEQPGDNNKPEDPATPTEAEITAPAGEEWVILDMESEGKVPDLGQAASAKFVLTTKNSVNVSIADNPDKKGDNASAKALLWKKQKNGSVLVKTADVLNYFKVSPWTSFTVLLRNSTKITQAKATFYHSTVVDNIAQDVQIASLEIADLDIAANTWGKVWFPVADLVLVSGKSATDLDKINYIKLTVNVSEETAADLYVDDITLSSLEKPKPVEPELKYVEIPAGVDKDWVIVDCDTPGRIPYIKIPENGPEAPEYLAYAPWRSNGDYSMVVEKVDNEHGNAFNFPSYKSATWGSVGIETIDTELYFDLRQWKSMSLDVYGKGVKAKVIKIQLHQNGAWGALASREPWKEFEADTWGTYTANFGDFKDGDGNLLKDLDPADMDKILKRIRHIKLFINASADQGGADAPADWHEDVYVDNITLHR